ncbi:dynein heavy chain, N-terminal region 1-domain-containing protein [Dipodascopsis tothii]|uniref:dynein heavy chain, N-terminal region 1-domain-containing protein n=1 Tax=Dipodascopsis tothii TaxID=44089 RepID=UPI0034D00DD3
MSNDGSMPASPGPLALAPLTPESAKSDVFTGSSDAAVLRSYIHGLLTVALEARDADLAESLFKGAATSTTDAVSQKLLAFASDPSTSTLFIYKVLEDSDGLDYQKYSYALQFEFAPPPNTVVSVAIIKRYPIVDTSQSLIPQLQFLNLPNVLGAGETGPAAGQSSSVYETLYSLLHYAIKPYFEAVAAGETKGLDRSEADTKAGVPAARKKLVELELSLLHLQQNIEIPQLTLAYHPLVQHVIDDAVKRNIKPSIDLIPRDKLGDSKFLNALQTNVNTWIKSIQTITKLTRDPASGTATQEINFWISMESVLRNIELQLQMDGVTLTIDVLKNAKRFHATMSFVADTGLKEATDQVEKYNLLMYEFPLDNLLSATSFAAINEAIVQIFSHFNKRLRISFYPVRRALLLVEAISADLDAQIHALLGGRRLMHVDYADFEAVIEQVEAIFATWDQQIKEFTNIARDVTRKRTEKFIPIRIVSKQAATQERLVYLKSFRLAHFRLQETLGNVLRPQLAGSAYTDAAAEGIADLDIAEETKAAFAILKDVDVLDVSAEGTEIWAAAEQAYNDRISRVENFIIAQLRDRLATAKTANEMFRVFSKFNPLFVRPKIRGAIHEYQAHLIENVKADIAALHERFKTQYTLSESYMMARLRDIPSVSGTIIWVQQIERQLNLYMRRVEDLLGTGWELYVEGEKLHSESTTFRKKLDCKPIYDSWLRAVTQRNIAISGPLFKITRSRAAGNSLVLAVNFDTQAVALFKEVRNLTYLKFQVPHAVNSVSKVAKRVYPYAISLKTSTELYMHASTLADDGLGMNILLNGYQNEAQALIKRGMRLKWEYFIHSYDLKSFSFSTADSAGVHESKYVQYVRELFTTISTLEKKVGVLADVSATIAGALDDLRTCRYDAETLGGVVDGLQNLVDRLNLESFANLPVWVASLNARVEQLLTDRLRSAIADWVDTFRAKSGTYSKPAPTKKVVPKLPALVFELVVRNQVIALAPPLAYAKVSWYGQLQDWLAVVLRLPKIQSERYELNSTLRTASATAARFENLAVAVAPELAVAYALVDSKLGELAAYVQKWYQFQSLWDLQAENVYSILGSDLARWIQIMHEIRRSRATFDTSSVSQSFGVAVIEYEQVQARVNAKYDTWQHSTLVRFAELLETSTKQTYAEFQKERKTLEAQSLDSSSTAHAVAFITTIESCKRKVRAWQDQIELYRQGQITLARQRFQFPPDWIYSDQINSEWTALNEILGRRSKLVEDQTDALRAKILAESHIINDQMHKAVEDWTQEKPVTGTVDAREATRILNRYEGLFTKLKDSYDLIFRAREALDLDIDAHVSLDTILEEIQDFKSVWAALSTIWASIGDLRETLWTALVARKVKTSLDGLAAMAKKMPTRVRQYAAFEHVQDALRSHLALMPLLALLKEDAVKERHWARVFKAAGQADVPASALTLGDVWDLATPANEPLLRDVVAQAQGEYTLEVFLRKTAETWAGYVLELTNYQNKCRLIRGWDEIFATTTEHLNALAAMHHSPYFKQFEEEATAWEDRINRIHALFDVWIDVQRQWVYLEGVFTGNVEIKLLLPAESARFQNINSEVFSLMRKVSRSPNVLDVLNIAGIQKSLERLQELLNKIQRSLGEYLERERLQFPRFFFVGDEDLLEIIGNSKDIVRIQKHFSKMFAGVASVEYDAETAAITAVVSREGERVALAAEVVVANHTKINAWMAALEDQVRLTLAERVREALAAYETLMADGPAAEAVAAWVRGLPSQATVLASQIWWTTATESALAGGSLAALVGQTDAVLGVLAALVLTELGALDRKKTEALITEIVYQRNSLAAMAADKVTSPQAFAWVSRLRYVYAPAKEPLARLSVHIGSAVFPYGYEYVGVPDRLVRTPLTDTCYLALTGALEQNLGGSPFGPAGTGKTETVKSLGHQLGSFVLVFCCDDTFDFQAMDRILLGICLVGAWGCFDEFNRLNEQILSAVSSQIQSIQSGLKEGAGEARIELSGRSIEITRGTGKWLSDKVSRKRCLTQTLLGVFVTMNPGYAGRSNLPDNLKQLFRSISMVKPEKELIAEVILYSQGFAAAAPLSQKVVGVFEALAGRVSPQPHYDFGLRAIKSILTSSGRLIRAAGAADADAEARIIRRSLRESIAPKLVDADAAVLDDVVHAAFPAVQAMPADHAALYAAVDAAAAEHAYVVDAAWREKIVQLYQMQDLHHGVILVGESGAGKTAVWTTLLAALEALEHTPSVAHVIDAKVMSKEALYGTLDATTREWTDGLLTGMLRKVIDNLRGETAKRHWIVFDGDIDPEWAESLNSVLDDNRLLTLPNGERLSLPANVRLLFEVETLAYATPATVSRCGMVWFGRTVSAEMAVRRHLARLRARAFDDDDDGPAPEPRDTAVPAAVADQVGAALLDDGLLATVLGHVRGADHVMPFSDTRAVASLCALVDAAARAAVQYNAEHVDFGLSAEQLRRYVARKLLVALVWALAGDCPLAARHSFGDFVAALPAFGMVGAPPGPLFDYDVALPDADWTPWQALVPTVQLDAHDVSRTDVVVPTIDTVRHEQLVHASLGERKPVVLCGPPGSGKTMILFNTLRAFHNMDVVGVNFSKTTTPELVVRTLEQYCEYQRTPAGLVLAPAQIGRWLVLFCDEVNLPAPDRYGTQRAIALLRQLVEQNGFWRHDRVWVALGRVQIVAACNPPTDVGRSALSERFLRHVAVVMVDYPGPAALGQIYGTFNRAVLRALPALRGFAGPLTDAMVDVYLGAKQRFVPTAHAHYVFSPRELTRWVRGVHEAVAPLETLALDGLIRVWAHEALRLFSDRLVTDGERQWMAAAVAAAAGRHFAGADVDRALEQPILFSNWLSKHYVPVGLDELRAFVRSRFRTFCEEEVDVPLVLYDDSLDHILRIDRVFRQPQGHLILIGVSGSGKTTLAKFVAWMNGLRIFQIDVHRGYSGADFDEDLRTVIRCASVKGEKVCFILDEASMLDSGFLERMNTLLANAEIPGLFEGDEQTALLNACKESARRQGVLLESADEVYQWFVRQIAANLHVVFTMNPANGSAASRAAASPALFNRCVLNWMGDWSAAALAQVGAELTQALDLDEHARAAVVDAMVAVPAAVEPFVAAAAAEHGATAFLTPRHFLDLAAHFCAIYAAKRAALAAQQRHLGVGLDKIRSTVDKVRELRSSLADKQAQLQAKNAQANDKLRRMVADQQETENRRAESVRFQDALRAQEAEIARRQAEVLADLARAEPAVAKARESVGSIKKQHLAEVRSMANPPEAVKLAMEGVCTLLQHRVDSWRAVQSVIRRDDFISSILNFDNDRQMTRALRQRMQAEYLAKPGFTFETVDRASKACGPIVLWIEAQVNYSLILDRIGPLRAEVDALVGAAAATAAEAAAADGVVAELEASIERYKDEYAALISQVQAIKAEMGRVQERVGRSVQLLESLSAERERWAAGSRDFERQTATAAGDALLAAALLAYGGFFDQRYRRDMRRAWAAALAARGVAHGDAGAVDYVATAEDRVRWQASHLPAGEIYEENALMVARSPRCPLLVDPTGRAVDFLRRLHADRALVVTSFLDAGFVKLLESALRFGNPLVIADAEHYDPVVNHVLNREYQRTGGRVLVRVGRQHVDVSPAFALFLVARDGAFFAPDVCARTTLVNFTVTRHNMHAQSLNELLRAERPDVDRQRTNLIKLKGEFHVRLSQLEDRLLEELNRSKGSLLDDDGVIATLESLKVEAGDVAQKIAETDGVMAKVEAITAKYAAVADACGAIFALLGHLHRLHHLYRFSLAYFHAVFAAVLRSRTGPGLDDLVARLYAATYRRTAQTLFRRDCLLVAVLLAYTARAGHASDVVGHVFDRELPLVAETGGPDDVLATGALARFGVRDAAALAAFVDEGPAGAAAGADASADAGPDAGADAGADADRALYRLLALRHLRSDRFVAAAESYVAGVIPLDDGDGLAAVVAEADAHTPVALCCVPGVDASDRVDALAAAAGVRCRSVALGSPEAVGLAERALAEAAAAGSWVVVKNVHLAAAWLDCADKRVAALAAAPGFRLFLTMDAGARVPAPLLAASRVVTFEPAVGMRASLRATFGRLAATRLAAPPAERARALLLVAWVHGVVQERAQYAGGWRRPLDVSDADFEFAAAVVDTWVARAAAGRSNVAPDAIAWDVVRAVVGRIVYGGKAADAADAAALAALADRVLVPDAFNLGFSLAPAGPPVPVPDGSRPADLAAWVDALAPDSPEWLGLPADARKL